MKRIYLAVVIVGICSFASFGQKVSEIPNLAGTWEAKDDNSSMFKSRKLIITQTGDELILNDSLEFEKKIIANTIKLYADKRGERNLFLFPATESAVEIKSKTVWKKGKLVRTMTSDTPVSRGTDIRYIAAITETQTYSLSEDEKILTVTTAGLRQQPQSDTPSPFSTKKVYRRAN